MVWEVSSLRYLGLIFTGSARLRDMASPRLVAARSAWGRLMGIIVSRGWRDRATRLLLFDAYVRSCLLFGVGLWGMELLLASRALDVDAAG